MQENPRYLSEQLITYIGNKRKLIGDIENIIIDIKASLGIQKISFADVFSGSGVISRLAKAHSDLILANDLEYYSFIINSCYLANASKQLYQKLNYFYEKILKAYEPKESFISRLYAPLNDENIQNGERAFYTRDNALILGGLRAYIDTIPQAYKHFFIAPLLSEASIHSNTGGVFKGFYKDKNGIGKFGGSGANALSRIKGQIKLQLPVLSNFASEYEVFAKDAIEFAKCAPKVDIAYFDPPYNQHPYGSNYFMLNLLCDFKEPRAISKVSGIPKSWKRSKYNKPGFIAQEFFSLLAEFKARYLIISFSSEGFIKQDELLRELNKIGQVQMKQIKYPAYRASRNLSGRELYVSEYLFVVKKG